MSPSFGTFLQNKRSQTANDKCVKATPGSGGRWSSKLLAVVEFRRHVPLITDCARALEFARIIAG